MSSQPTKDIPALDRESSSRLIEFARACKAAARAVSLYPSTHPAIRLSLARLSETASRIVEDGPVTLGVLPEDLLIDGCASSRPDQAVRETGTLLHEHMIGLITMHSSPEPEGWLPFLNLLARPIDEIRAAGGVARSWSATGQRYLEIQEIDYADILRDRGAGDQSRWDNIIRSCLNLDAPLDDEALQQLVDLCGDPEKFGDFLVTLEKSGGAAMGSKASALIRMLRGVVDLMSKTGGRLEPMLRNVAQGLGKLSPEMVMELLSTDTGRSDATANLVLGIASRMTDATLGSFVASAVVAENGATTRLAEAFQALVPDEARRPGLLEIAKEEVAQSPLGQEEDFDGLWQNVSDMLTSYSDAKFVSDAYARELSSARTAALEVERVSDDPPDRIDAWLTSVGAAELRSLDLQLLLDLLRLEEDPARWAALTPPTVNHIEDLLLLGDFDGALQLLNALANEVSRETPRKRAAEFAMMRLVQGTMMGNITSHLRTVDDATTAQIGAICHAVGELVIQPLAEALSIEKRTTSRQRLTQLLLGFGAAGRQSAEKLKTSANPAVRRTAIYLLREFGGQDALPDLTGLLDDADPQIQREAVRAILGIGSDQAYAELQKALASGNDNARESLVNVLISMRSERAIPLFEYIVQNIDRKGPLRSVYLRAVESLGELKAETATNLLKSALYAGEFWSPFRTAEVRRTVAIALVKIGTPEAQQVLDEGADRGPRGVRAAVKKARAS